MKFALARFGIAAPLLLALCAIARAGSYDAVIAQIAKQFDTHPLVMIGEMHRSRQIHAFLQQALRDPGFVCRADDVVLESGNARLQKLADIYASGGTISEAQLVSMWRETVPPLTWNSPLYRQLYETIREINARHLCTHAIRIVLADTPIDWSKVKTVKDYLPFTDRDRAYAGAVEREVLARHHRALLIAGSAHAWKKVPKDEYDEPNTAEILNRKHPGALFAIVTVPRPETAKALAMGPAPSFRVVRGSALEHATLQFTNEASTVTQVPVDGKKVWEPTPDKHWPLMGEGIDGILYVGGNDSLYPSPTIYLDPAYQNELRRRARIIKAYSGQDFLPGINELVRQGEATEKAKRP